MISDLQIFHVYGAMARHAAESQGVSATNIARAGEPGYKAMKVEPFTEYMARVGTSTDKNLFSEPFRRTPSAGPVAPNGNSVSVEHEAFTAAEAGGQHALAMTVYSKSMDLMRLAIGRRS